MAGHPRRISSAWAAALLFAACQRGPSEAPKTGSTYPAPQVLAGGEVIAQIGPVTLTTAEIEKRIMQQTPFARVQLRDPEQKRRFVENEIRMELLAQEAWRRGLPQDPRVQAEVKRLVVQRLMSDEMDAVGKKLEVSDVEVLEAYKAREAEFNKPDRIRVSQIVRYVEDDGQRKAAKKLLEGLKAQVIAAQKKNDHGAFAEAAREHSQDETSKGGGGDLQFLSKQELTERYGPEVAAYLFDEVQVGDMGVADAPNAVVLFKKTGLRRGQERTVEQVKPQLRGQLVSEKRGKAFDQLVEELMKSHRVDVQWSAVEAVKVELEAPTAATP